MSIIADLVVTSATAAFAHFGVTLDMPERTAAPPPAERTVARTPARKARLSPLKSSDCPEKDAKPLKAPEALA